MTEMSKMLVLVKAYNSVLGHVKQYNKLTQNCYRQSIPNINTNMKLSAQIALYISSSELIKVLFHYLIHSLLSSKSSHICMGWMLLIIHLQHSCIISTGNVGFGKALWLHSLPHSNPHHLFRLHASSKDNALSYSQCPAS